MAQAKKNNFTSAIVARLERIASLLGIKCDIRIASGRNRRNTLTPIFLHPAGSTGSSVYGSGSKSVMVLAVEALRLWSGDELAAALLAGQIILGILERGDEEEISSLGDLGKGGYPRGPQGIRPLLADAGIRFASPDKKRGLGKGSVRDTLRFQSIAPDDNREAISDLEALSADFHGFTEADKDGNELDAAQVNNDDLAAAVKREADRVANEELAKKFAKSGLAKVRGLWLPEELAETLAQRLKSVKKDILSEERARQTGAAFTAWAMSYGGVIVRLDGLLVDSPETGAEAKAAGKADAKVG